MKNSISKILILIGGHLCTAPRPQKEAEAIAKTGYAVTVSGFWFDHELIDRDLLLIANKPYKFVPILDFQPAHRLTNLSIRTQSLLAKSIYRRLGIFSPGLLGYGASAMLKVARQAKADLTIVHSEGGLWVGNKLLDEGFQVGVDFEDWFSEDLLLEARIDRPIEQIKQFEQRLIQTCKYCITTSHAMAEAMADTYNAPQPTVIHNSFPWSEREHLDRQIKDRQNLNIPSLHWFSQTIGPGRGLETLFQALSLVNQPAEIHLRGNYSESARQWLEPLIPEGWREQIFIHPTVPNAELLSRIAEHDIGLALESSDIISRDLTITNKFFQYLQAGLAVIATDTTGQRDIFEKCPLIGQLIPSSNPVTLAQALNSLLSDSERLATAKAAALIAAQTNLSWENQSQQLVNLVHTVIKTKKSSYPITHVS